MSSEDEKRGYAKGYAAGRRRSASEFSRDLAKWRREQFRQQAALIALQQMMIPGNAWGRTVEGKHQPYKSMVEYAEGAFTFADSMLKHTWFSGDQFPSEDRA